jgi:CYTH domain-containing protein
MGNNTNFEKLAKAEEAFFQSEFICPVLRNKPVRIRIAGVIVNLTVKNHQGWGVFRPNSYKSAIFVRNPTLAERNQYLELFPVLRLILCRRINDQWFGIPANHADTRFIIKGLAPINLVEEVQLFEVIQTRFDGMNCWFDALDNRHPSKNSVYLRDSLNALLEPAKLTIPGLTQEEKDAYLMAYGPALAADIELRKDQKEERIKAALGRAGAQYRSYIERGNTFTIEYAVGRENHRSVVDKNSLAVQSAGICLSGGDRAFDLQSLVGVIREGQRRRAIVRVGDNQYNGDDDYDDYD